MVSAPCRRDAFQLVCLVAVVMLVSVLLPHNLSLMNVPLLWERQITSHDGFVVWGDKKQNLLYSHRQDQLRERVEHAIILPR